MVHKIILLCVFFLANVAFAQNTMTQKDDKPAVDSVYELRIYYPHEGKLEGILSRFRNHTTALFEKHGFTNVGYWITQPNDSASFATRIIAKNKGKEALLYLVSFPNMDARDKSWDAFVNDPEWKKVYAESRENGPLVNEIEQIFLSPTDFSLLK